MIDSFRGTYGFLSNFYPVDVIYEGIVYPTVEHAFVAAKSHDFSFKKKISALDAKQAGRAKRMGRSIQIRPDWEKVKEDIMRRLLQKKFMHPYLAKMLLDTGNEGIIEGNYWHDNYWGVCNCGKCNGGKNILGILLYKIREELKHESINSWRRSW